MVPFESAFDLDYKLGLLITGGVVVAYTLFGGFLAVSLTDFVQGIIMFLALVLVPIVAFTDVGGIQPTFDVIREIILLYSISLKVQRLSGLSHYWHGAWDILGSHISTFVLWPLHQ